MPYACHKCGSTIDDGTPFCPHCGAPQIRVAPPEGDAAEVPAPGSAPAGDFPRPAAPPLPSSITSSFQWRLARRPILVGGAIILAGSIIPLGALWYLLIILAGAVATVSLYRRQPLTGGEVAAGTGAKLGAAAALACFSVYAMVIVLGCVFVGTEVRQQVIVRVQTTQSQMTDPQSRAAAQTLLQQLNTPEGFATIVTLGLALSLIFFLVFGAIGGALGAKLFGRTRR